MSVVNEVLLLSDVSNDVDCCIPHCFLMGLSCKVNAMSKTIVET